MITDLMQALNGLFKRRPHIRKVYQAQASEMIDICRKLVDANGGGGHRPADDLLSMFLLTRAPSTGCLTALRGLLTPLWSPALEEGRRLKRQTVLFSWRPLFCKNILWNMPTNEPRVCKKISSLPEALQKAETKHSVVEEKLKKVVDRVGEEPAKKLPKKSTVSVTFCVRSTPVKSSSNDKIIPHVTVDRNARVSEVLWILSCLPPETRICLQDNPHIYLIDTHTAKAHSLTFEALSGVYDWKSGNPVFMVVLDRKARIFLECGTISRTFGNLWKLDGSAILLKDTKGRIQSAELCSRALPPITGVDVFRRPAERILNISQPSVGLFPDPEETRWTPFVASGEWTEILNETLDDTEDWLFTLKPKPRSISSTVSRTWLVRTPQSRGSHTTITSLSSGNGNTDSAVSSASACSPSSKAFSQATSSSLENRTTASRNSRTDRTSAASTDRTSHTSVRSTSLVAASPAASPPASARHSLDTVERSFGRELDTASGSVISGPFVEPPAPLPGTSEFCDHATPPSLSTRGSTSHLAVAAPAPDRTSYRIPQAMPTPVSDRHRLHGWSDGPAPTPALAMLPPSFTSSMVSVNIVQQPAVARPAPPPARRGWSVRSMVTSVATHVVNTVAAVTQTATRLSTAPDAR
ncbi:hypothetical protein FA95DRAFT_1037936 [Auriscalpium vulgare]|uniref:Uncharacterized protein n=1 Tax=Auriscalpium vulgare TaxID=40419 RepID=A0ACB8RWN7_9AGAM|nr:hypothetical protein FA95DRAFT_1037936 [Auriscalpium vulgare]